MGVAQKSWVTSKNQSHDLSLKKDDGWMMGVAQTRTWW
jgi:hypothetical protein